MEEETNLNYRLVDMANGMTYIGKNTPTENLNFLVLAEVTVHSTEKLYEPYTPDLKMMDNQVYTDTIKAKHFSLVRKNHYLLKKSLKLENIVANDDLEVTSKDLK